MDIQNQIIEFAENHCLKEKALSAIDEVMEASIESEKLDRYRINERIKNEKLIMAKKS